MTNFRKIADALLRPVTDAPIFCGAMFALGVVCILFEPWLSLRYLSLLELPFDVYLLCLIPALLPRRAAGVVRLLLAVVLYAVALLDNTLFVTLGAPLSGAVLRAFLNTNAAEASEAVQSFASVRLLFSQLPIIIGLIVAHIWLTLKPIKLRVAKRWRGAILLAVGVSFCGGLMNKVLLFHRLILAQSDTELPQYVMDADIKTGYYLPVYRFWEAAIEIARDGRAVSRLIETADRCPIDSCSHLSPHIVVVFGESYNRSHSSLYGYHLPTSPSAKQRMERGELAVFTDVVTPWNFTTEAFEHLLSLHGYGDAGQWCDYPLFTCALRRAGYRLTFISNQYVLHPDRGAGRLIDTQLLNEPKLSALQFDSRNVQRHAYDEELLADFDALQPLQAPFSCTLFHLQGQHVEFADRVPPGRSHFTPEMYDRDDLPADLRQKLADYDNATLYVDSVVEQLVRRIEHRDAILLFVPDHGERVFDEGTATYGRNNSLRPTDVRQQYEIPFYIWASTAYREKRPGMWQKIMAARHLPFMTDNLAQMLLYLSGTSTPYYRAENNPLEAGYNAARPRLLRGKHEYREAAAR